jgi:TetR/AcrR family transcriptional repressor of nem operon
MRKSRVETAETRKRIVETASKVFLEHGIAATGIADIMAAAGLTQGGFYRHFESKEQLVAEASEVAFDQILERIEASISGMAPRQALDTIVQIYLYQREKQDPVYLCPLASLGSELPHADEHLKAVVNIGYTRMVSYFGALLQQINIRDPHSVADAMVSTLLGAVTLSRIALTAASGKSILENARKTVALILNSAPTVEAVA